MKVSAAVPPEAARRPPIDVVKPCTGRSRLLRNAVVGGILVVGIGLSSRPADIERNTDLLTEENGIDLPVRFKPGPQALLAFDKGAAGTQMMQSAFDQWKQ